MLLYILFYQLIYHYVLYLHFFITFIISLFALCLVFFFFQTLVISKIHMLSGLKVNEDDVCLADYAITHIILRDKRYFLKLTLTKVNVNTISILQT